MNEENKIVIYQTEDGQTQIDVRLENDTVWLTQAQMAELFQKDQSVIARHINNAVKEGELEENSNMQFLHNTQYKYRPTRIYDLDVIISIGYRVKSKRGTALRILSTRPKSWLHLCHPPVFLAFFGAPDLNMLIALARQRRRQLSSSSSFLRPHPEVSPPPPPPCDSA